MRGDDVLFGGYGANGAVGDTWVFNGTTWSKPSTPTAPSPRWAADMAFDAATGTTILFGGYSGSAHLADTWSWNGSSWTQLFPSASPPPRNNGAMVDDPALGKVVLFGGYGNAGRLSDTWTFNGTTWTQVSTAGPDARFDSGMAWDAASGDVVLFGGSSNGGIDGDTWLYGSSGWTQASPAHYPGGRAGEGLAFDPVLNRVVFFGGYDASYTYDDAWLWSGSDWESASAGLVPNYRSRMAMVTAAGHGQLLAYGGQAPNGDPLGDTHLYDWVGAGGAPGATIESHPTTDRSSYGVDVGNGNLVVSATDLRVSGIGIKLGFTRVYNSAVSPELTPGSGSGYGWAFTTGRDVYLSGLPDGSLVLYGYGGAAGQLYFQHNPNGTFTSPPGVGATLATAGSGYTLKINSSGEDLTFGTSQSNGLLASDADRNGNAVTFTYNSAQQMTDVYDTQGRHYTLAYSSSGNLASITDPTGRQVTYGYTNGYLTTATDPVGATTTYSYNSAGVLSNVLDPAQTGTNVTGGNGGGPGGGSGGSIKGCTATGGTGGGSGGTSNNICGTFFGYDTNLRVTSAANNLAGTSATYAYATSASSGAWLQTTSTNGNNQTTTYQASYAGPVVMVTDGLGRSRPSTYNTNDDTLVATDAMGSGNTPGNSTTFTYDSLNNPTVEKAPTGAASYLGYANGQAMGSTGKTCSTGDSSHPYLAKCAMDAQGNMSSFTYDGPGNMLTATSATSGLQASKIYNPPGTPTCGGKPGQLCSTTNGNGNTTAYSYDSTGNLLTVTPPSPHGAITNTYDTLGRLIMTTDGQGQTTSSTYNADDRVTQILTGGATTCTPSANTCDVYGYDADGNLTTQTDATGTTAYTYDAASREVAKQLASGASLTLTYDPASNILTYTDPGGTVTYSYDAAHELTSLKEPSGATTTFGYNKNSLRTSTVYPGGTTMTVVPDKSSRLTEIKATNGAATLSDLAYSYTQSANDTALTQTATDKVTGKINAYRYDTLNRLSNAVQTTNGTTTASWLYCYDNDGNRTSSSTTPGATCPSSTATYHYNAADELTARNGSGTGWTYDANGNETAAPAATTRTAETYSASNQLTSLTTNGTAISFSYAGLNNTERTGAGSTTYQTGEEGLANETARSNTTSFTRDPSGTLVSERINGTSYYYLYDGKGSVTGLVNATGTKLNTYTYDPYGNSLTKTEAVTNPFQYAAGYLDPTTGLYHYGARYYDPTIGRWTQLDSTGKSVGYSYAGDDPIDFTDPSGRLSNECGYVTCTLFLNNQDLTDLVAYGGEAFAGLVAGAISLPFPFDAPALIGAIIDGIATAGLGAIALSGGCLKLKYGVEFDVSTYSC